MHILDTNHYSEINRCTVAGQHLQARIGNQDVDVFLTIITAEESMRGWLASLNSTRGSLVPSYARFHLGMGMLSKWSILDWTDDAETIFLQLRRMGIRIGTLDLRIAAIALVFNATMLSRNLKDLRQVPGLTV